VYESRIDGIESINALQVAEEAHCVGIWLVGVVWDGGKEGRKRAGWQIERSLQSSKECGGCAGRGEVFG